MRIFRFAAFVALMALMVPLGSTSATTTTSAVPNGVIDSPALDLRAAGSRLVVETIEDALRQGGLALFEEGFQLDSSLNWVFGETIEGEVDAVVPLLDRDGHVVFAQPGFVFWTGLEEDERADGNLGLVYRTRLANTHFGVDAVGGASVFYDHDFKNGHGRAGFGADIQSGVFHGAFNYYHPLTSTRDGREGFVEDALRGMDFRVALERDVMRVGANLGYWRFEGDEEVKGDWKSSYGFDAGIRIVPGVFLEGGWERHDETVSLDRRWNAGLAFRFSLPDFKGASYGDGDMSSNLWKVVEREKRILYEERLGIPRVNIPDVMYGDAEDQRVGAVSEGNTVTVMAELGKPLDEDVTLSIMVAETSTAEFGEDKDFTYGYKVYELDAATGEQSAPANAEPCMGEMCAVPVPAGVTRFDIEADIRADSVAQEIPKFIDFQIEVPEEHAGLLRDSFVERITLRGHGNTVEFASATSTLGEDGGTVDVAVNANLASPRPITLDVSATSTNAVEDQDYTISSGSLTIPANPNGASASASVRLTGINNNRGEGSKTIELTISGTLPDGWAFGSQTTHTVTLQDDDLSIFFTSATSSRVDEPGTGNADVTIAVGITQAPAADITVSVAATGGGANPATPGSTMDYTFPAMNFTFPRGSVDPQTATFSVHDDNFAELDEFIVLTLSEVGNSLMDEGSGFSLGDPHTITIPANDNTVSFASDAADTLSEGNETTGVQVSVSVAMPSPTPITLNVATTGTATVGEDYTISGTSLAIPANASSASLTLWGEDNTMGEGNKEIVLTFTGNLPDGWAFASDPFTHTVTLQDDDLSVGFEFMPGSNIVDEPDSDTDHTVTVRITNPPTANVTLEVATLSSSSTTNADVTLDTTSVTFEAGTSQLTQTVTLNVKHDTVKEPAEFVNIRLNDSGNTLTTGGNTFSWGVREYRLNIRASDNTISINSDMSDSTVSENTTSPAEIVVSVDDHASPDSITLNVSATSSSTPAAMEDVDYEIPDTLTIAADSKTGSLEITTIDDELEEGDLMLDVTLTASSLPTGWALTGADGMPSTSLTYQLTITDDERPVVRWAAGNPTSHTGPEAGQMNTLTLTVEISSAPSVQIDMAVSLAGVAQGPDFYYLGIPASEQCQNIVFPANATSDQLTQSCKIGFRPRAVGKTVTATLVDSRSQGIAIDPAANTLEIEITAP